MLGVVKCGTYRRLVLYRPPGLLLPGNSHHAGNLITSVSNVTRTMSTVNIKEARLVSPVYKCQDEGTGKWVDICEADHDDERGKPLNLLDHTGGRHQHVLRKARLFIRMPGRISQAIAAFRPRREDVASRHQR